MEEKNKGQNIRVTDRRSFDPKGKRRVRAQKEEKPKHGHAAAGGKDTSSEKSGEGARLPETVNFVFFVQSLYGQACMHLGDLEDPATREFSGNLDAAGITIDFLGILLEKTRGNLDPDEKKHLEEVLYDLRMRFAKKVSPS